MTFALLEIIPQTLSSGELEANQIRLRQNPVQDFFSLTSNEMIESSKVELFDLSGRKVQSAELGNWVNQIDVRLEVSSGIYLLELSTANGNWSTKLIVR